MAQAGTTTEGQGPRLQRPLRVLRRLALSLIALVLSVVLAGLLLAGWFLSEHRYVAFLEQELERLFLAEVELGSSTLSFRQGVGVQFKTVRMQAYDASDPFVTAERIDLVFDLRALLRGQLLFRQLVFLKPSVRFAQPDAEPTAPVARLFSRRAKPPAQETETETETEAETEATADADRWFSPQLLVQQLVLDDATLVFQQTETAAPVVLTHAHLRIVLEPGGGMWGQLTTDLGQNGEVGQLVLRSRAAQWEPTGDTSGVEWQGHIDLQNIALRELGEWFGADWPSAHVDFSGSYSGKANARTNVSGLVSVRAARLSHVTVNSGRIGLTDLHWDNPGYASSWFVAAPLAGLLESLTESPESLTFNGTIEEVDGRIGKNSAPVRLTSGQLHVEDGHLRASKMKGSYGRSSVLTDLGADLQPLFSKKPPTLKVKLAARINLADDLDSLLSFMPGEEREAFGQAVQQPSGQADIRLSAQIPTGKKGDISYSGTAEWRSVGVVLPEWGLSVSEVNGVVHLTPEEATLRDIRFRIGTSVGLLEGAIEQPLSSARRGRIALSIPQATVRDFVHLLDAAGVQHGQLSGRVDARFGPERHSLETEGSMVLSQARVDVLSFLEPLDIARGQFSWRGQQGRFVIEQGSWPGGRVAGSGEIRSFEPLDMQVSVECAELDFGSMLILDPVQPEQKEQEEQEEQNAVRVDVRCDRVQYKTFEATQVRASAYRHDRQVDFSLEEAGVSAGHLRGKGTLWLDSAALSVAPQVSQVDASDFFAALSHPTDIISGTLDATGDIEIANWEYWDDPEEWDGELTLSVQNGVAQQLPILVRLWTAVSLQSIFRFSLPQFPREGLPFSALSGDMVVAHGELTTENLSLVGEAVRLDARGRVNLRQQTVDLTTDVIPLRGLTSVVEKVPLAGKLLAQSADRLTTLPFQVYGPYHDPQVRLRLLKKVVP